MLYSSECDSKIIVGVVCSLVFQSVGVLLGAVGVHLIQRAKPPSSSPPPVPPAATYEEMDVSGEVTSSIPMRPMLFPLHPTLSAYWQMEL